MMTTLKYRAFQVSTASQGARTLETLAPTQPLKRSFLPKRRLPTLYYNGWDKPTDPLIASRTMSTRDDTIVVGSVADLIRLTNVTSFTNPSRALQSRGGVKCVSGILPMKPRIAIGWEDNKKTQRE